MTPALRRLILDSPGFNPYLLPNTAARYDFTNLSSLIYDGSNRTSLAGDLSGNSNVNVLALNGVAGNYASAPDSAAVSITGDIDLRACIALDNWTPTGVSYQVPIAKRTAGSYQLTVLPAGDGGSAGAGSLRLNWWDSGGTLRTANSTVIVGATNYSAKWIRVTLDVDNGAAGNTVTFYTSDDGISWTTLGAAVTQAFTTTVRDNADAINIGFDAEGAYLMGRIYRAQIYNGIAGTLVFDANFATAPKLCSSFIESSTNAAVVTINTSGATGARVCGARDLYQGTVANQLVLQAGGGLLANGTSQYAKTAAFSLPQPISLYLVGTDVSWTANDRLFDGNASNSNSLQQFSSSNNVRFLSGNIPTQAISAGTIGTSRVLGVIFNGTGGSLRVNTGAAVSVASDNPGTAASNGFTLAANASGTTDFANILVREVIIRNVADSQSLQDRIINYLLRKHRIAA